MLFVSVKSTKDILISDYSIARFFCKGRYTKSCAYKNQQGIRAAIILYAACIVCAVKDKNRRGAHTKEKKGY